MIQDFILNSKCHFCDAPATCHKTGLSHGFILMSCVDHITDLENLTEILKSKCKKYQIDKKIDNIESILDEVFKDKIHLD